MRLHEMEGARREDETRKEDGNMILGDDREQRGHCSDLRGDWIDKASGYADVDTRHMTGENEIEQFPSRELLKPSLPSYGPAIAFSNVDVLPDNVAAPFASVTSHAGDNTRSRDSDIGATSCSAMRFSYAAGTSCNVACSNAPSATCNIAPAGNGAAATWFRDDNGPLAESPIAGTRAANRICQLGPVDVEDLAMYFDSPTDGCKPPSAGNRAIYSRKSRYGQTARMDQLREYPRDLDLHYLPSYDPAPDLRTYDMDSGNLRYSDLGYDDPRLRGSPYDGPRFYGSRFCQPKLDDPRVCGARPCEEEPSRHDPGPSNWFCNDCPELFNFCSEERWLQCPASDRCPLYDVQYAYGAPVLPPCMYENGYNDNDNWHYGYIKDEQLLEDYL